MKCPVSDSSSREAIQPKRAQSPIPPPSAFMWRVLALFRRQITFLCSMNLLRLPLVCFYYFYVWMPLFFLALFLKYALVVLQVSSRRSSSFKRLIRHYVAFHKTIINITRKIRRSSLSELTEWILATVYEVVFTIFDESDDALHDGRMSNPLHFAELIGYMEVEEVHGPQQRRKDTRMRHRMHQYVPSRPFRAAVRIHPQRSVTGGASPPKPSLAALTHWLQQKHQRWLRGRGSSAGGAQSTDTDYLGAVYGSGLRSASTGGGLMTAGTCSVSDLWSEVESASRTSVPRSPETLARVTDRSRDRVDSVVFFVRDKLRLEEQCQCHDDNSRSMASQLLSKGKFGVFDPYHTNKAVELSAGLHCAGVRRALSGGGGQSSQSLAAPFPPAKQPARVSEGADEVGSGSGRSSRAGRGSASSLQSLDSSGSLSGSSRNRAASPHIAAPLFHSTRAAIPLMQDAFVYFEYFIKSSSPGSLSSRTTKSSASGSPSSPAAFPVVSVGLASCDFSLDAMVGCDDRSLGLGLFPEDCQHACRLYLSQSSSSRGATDKRRRAAAERSQDEDEEDLDEEEEGGTAQARARAKAALSRSSFDMLGCTASSGDRIGVLVYICGDKSGEGSGGSSFGKDPSTDCLEEQGGTGRCRHNSLDGPAQACRESPGRDMFPGDLDRDDSEFQYECDFEDESGEDEPEVGGVSHLAALLLEAEEDEEDEEDEEEHEGMHVRLNLNGCPLNVPWPAMSQIADIPWGHTALYPTVSFTVHASADSASPPLSTSGGSSGAITTCCPGGSRDKDPEGKEEREEREIACSATAVVVHNTVKIWGGFCVDDVECRSREAIGAPPGVCVYCLDGSVLLSEDVP